MISVLLYSRNSHSMVQIIADQLDSLGITTEQTQILTIPRLILNSDQVIHFVIEELPLTLNEFVCLTTAKALNKAIVISILNTKDDDKKLLLPAKSNLFHWISPDALTVSQTNHLKIFRNLNSLKMILPTLFKMQPNHEAKSSHAIQGFIFPLFHQLEEAFLFASNKPTYFDGRHLLKKFPSSHLRKQWTFFLHNNKIKSHHYLILSDKKIASLLEDEPLGLIVASPKMQPTAFANWVMASLQRPHLLVMNHYQATGFSNHWTSGHNCFVTTSHHWLKDLNANCDHPIFNTPFAISDMNKTSLDSLFNELSRLYTKIIHQKTSLLDSDSAKI